MTIRVQIQPDGNDDYTVRTRDGANGSILLSSTSQGYADRAFAEHIARRHFPAVGQPFDNHGNDIESVVLEHLDLAGKVLSTEQLR